MISITIMPNIMGSVTVSLHILSIIVVEIAHLLRHRSNHY